MKFFTITFILLFSLFSSQEASFNGSLSIKSYPFQVDSFGKSDLNIYYKFEFKAHSDTEIIPLNSICVLQINDNYTKFSDQNVLLRDSLVEKYSHKNNIGATELNSLMKYKSLWPAINLNNLGSNISIYQNQARDLYQYSEKNPSFDWNLLNEKKQILGYECSSAETTYRGRKYIAWYTQKIQKNSGPYVFNGLPGLILEIADTEGKFHFIAVGIDRKPVDMYLKKDKSILITTRDKFREVQKAYVENPSAFHGTSYNQDGSVIIQKPNKSIYDPMERN